MGIKTIHICDICKSEIDATPTPGGIVDAYRNIRLYSLTASGVVNAFQNIPYSEKPIVNIMACKHCCERLNILPIILKTEEDKKKAQERAANQTSTLEDLLKEMIVEEIESYQP